ncbi:heterokaryon incompatibility protein-domain-containing protein [Neurospora tetraspora]|uniref:Heterokaryon incompatibility protein-domain-containing protein n=1 Tax=Neurospora tetraspora TaxID=94610 RepID=A0AAE0MY86_9PEZI|nr:heterokaryon incompatibility protein-domain-containing protein [Neurospora tetraspora]
MYRPLDTVNREIRLVELEPSENDDEVISFVLRYTPLADTKGRLKFSALSYCWGFAEEPHPVMIRDEKDRKNILASVSMSVNRNLYSALRRLRRRQEPQTLWIDLVCIKQSDLKERAQQVELMGEIYSSAHTVYVWLGEGDPGSYEDSLLGGLDMEATDPRDKIFALLSFGEETHNISQLPPQARPSYEKNTIEVFSDFTKWWISCHDTLNILSAVHAQPWRTWMDLSPLGAAPHEFDHAQRPSWSFWYEGRSEWSLGTFGLFNNRGLDLCASAKTMIDVDLLSRPNTGILALKGFRVDLIKSREFYHYSKENPYANSATMLAAYEAIFDPTSVLDMWDMTKLNWQQSLSAKLKSDNNDSNNIPSEIAIMEEDSKLFSHFQSHGFRGCEDLDEFQEDDPPLRFFPCHGKCLFTTEGDKVGLCPAGAKEGDIIVILYGGNVPYLLRPANNDTAEDRFYLVGECYLDGFMHGEAMELLLDDGSGVKEEVFSLV